MGAPSPADADVDAIGLPSSVPLLGVMMAPGMMGIVGLIMAISVLTAESGLLYI